MVKGKKIQALCSSYLSLFRDILQMAPRWKQSGPFCLETVLMRGYEKVAELINWRVLRLRQRSASARQSKVAQFCWYVTAADGDVLYQSLSTSPFCCFSCFRISRGLSAPRWHFHIRCHLHQRTAETRQQVSPHTGVWKHPLHDRGLRFLFDGLSGYVLSHEAHTGCY